MPSPLKPRRSPRSRMSLAGTGSGGVPLGGSSMTTKSSLSSAAAKENSHSSRLSSSKEDTMRATKEKVASKKRAASVGGSELDNLLKETQAKADSTTTSRRNAPAPRKSAIRQVPQVFLSPTGLVPSPESRKGLPMPSLTEQIAQLGKPEPTKSNSTTSRTSLPNTGSRARDGNHNFSNPSLDAPASASQKPVSRNALTQVIRPKRRVTFSARQEKTEFARDEPTLRLRSLRREESSPNSTPASSSVASVGFASFVASDDDSEESTDSDDDDDSDMDLEVSVMDFSGRSLAASIAASLPHDDSTLDPDTTGDGSSLALEGDATVSMQITASHGSVHKRGLENDSSMSIAAADADQMDMTQAIGSAPALKRRRSNYDAGQNPSSSFPDLHPGSDDSDMSISMGQDADSSNMNLDQTATMELTNVNVAPSSVEGDESYMTDASDGDGMDMTKAITTKIEAKRNGDETTTILTGLPDVSIDSEGDETIQADATMPMDMTKAITGFIREKEAASSDMDLVDQSSSMAFPQPSSDDSSSMAMDMTVPVGRIADTSAISPVKPSKSPATRLGTGAPSPFQPSSAAPKSPSKFRQSLRGGMAALESPNRSSAQRVGGNPLPPAQPSASTQEQLSSFRRSIIGGVASPAYKHSPARRVPTASGQQVQQELQQPPTPLTASNLSFAGLSRSAQKPSPSPSSKFAKMDALHRDRKSLGGVASAESSSLFRANHSPKRRAGRSSLVAAVLPDLSMGATSESFHSAVESGGKSSEDSDANGTISDLGDGIESFEDYSNNEGLAQVPAQMPLNDFLGFVGVHFNDDMNASRRRPIPPSKSEDGNTNEDMVAPATEGPIGMMRLVKAACGAAPQLEALREACREIKEQVDDGKEKMAEMEQAFYDSPPDFVREIMGLQNEEEKKEMEAQFKLQKQAARALVCADYYGWRLDKEFDQEMIQTLEAYHGRLQCDLHIVNTKKQQLQEELLPVLRAKHAKLRTDLQMAKQRQAEIETCDAEELKGLYSSIEEQHEVLESMRGKLLDVEEQHQRLLIRLEENREKMAVAQEMVDKAHATVDQIQGYTRGEAGRLLREIRNLEKLHLVRVIDNGFESEDLEEDSATKGQQRTREVILILDGWLQVVMSLAINNTPQATARVQRITLKQRGTQTVEFGTNMVRRLAVQSLQTDFDADFEGGVSQDGLLILRKISQTLIRQRILLAEIEHLRCWFPVDLVQTKGGDDAVEEEKNEVSLRATVLLPNKKSKIVITAMSDIKGTGESRSILLADSVKVEKIYGAVDAEAMSLQILDCIETDPTIGSLSKAFIETIETFDS